MASTDSPDSSQPPLSSSADHPASTNPGTPPSPLMAQASTLQLPESFDAKVPDAWPRWKKRFERYRIASALNDKQPAVQVNTLVYAMGGDAEDILASFNLSSDDEKSYSTVLGKFEDHIVSKKNPIFERARFNQRHQQHGESVEAFVTALHHLAQHCEYGTLKSEMIRDRLVVGLLDARLSEKLQLKDSLTLETAVKEARQTEAVKGQQATIRPAEIQPAAVAAVRAGGKTHRKTNGAPSPCRDRDRDREATSSSPDQNSRSCNWCGNQPHDRSRCPARNATCLNCSKRGHFSRVCKTSALPPQRVAAVVDDEEDYFLGAVHNDQSESAWKRSVYLHGTPLTMTIDTGADVTAIPECTYLSTLSSNPILMFSRRILKGPDGRPLDVVGSFETTLSLRSASDRSSCHTVYVVRGLQTPLLGLPAITALKMFSTDTLSRVPVSALSSSDTELQAEVDASAVFTSSSFVIETDSLPAAVERLPKIAAARAHAQREDLSSSDAPIALQPKQPTSSPLKQQSTPTAKKERETKSTSRNTTSGSTSSRARPNG